MLDKPGGLTSNQALRKVQHLYKAAKAGHTGSLDPLATGVLPLCFGRATKVAQQLLEAPKTYSTTILLGVSTTTGDIEGEVLQRTEVSAEMIARIPEVVKRFLGAIQQVPPMYSALKHQGQPLYKLARRGIEIERAPRSVEIYRNDIKAIEADRLSLVVRCSKGTYIRVLAEDIGKALGCGGCVMELRRLAAGPYCEQDACTLAELEMLSQDGGMVALDAHLRVAPTKKQ